MLLLLYSLSWICAGNNPAHHEASVAIRSSLAASTEAMKKLIFCQAIDDVKQLLFVDVGSAKNGFV